MAKRTRTARAVTVKPPPEPERVKPLRERLDELLEESRSGEWSNTRFGLTLSITAFVALSFIDPQFRDPGSFVTVILVYIAAVVGPAVFDMRVTIGKVAAKAAESIARRFTKTETMETTETDAGEPGAVENVEIDAENVTVKKTPKKKASHDTPEPVRSKEKQEP